MTEIINNQVVANESVTRSASIKNLAKALSLAQAEYPTVAKNKTATVQMKAGGRYSYRYADIADVIAAVAPVNAKHGLCFFQIPQTKNKQHQLVSTVLHESGEFIEGILDLEPADRSPQSLGSAITYGRRYALGAMLGVVTEEDEDGKLATEGSRSESKARTQPAESSVTAQVAKARSVLTALMRDAGLNKQDGLDYCSMVVGRDIADKNELSLEELMAVATKLKTPEA